MRFDAVTRLTPGFRALLVLGVCLAAACSYDVPIMQAQTTCHQTGHDTSNVTMYALYEGAYGWGPLHVHDWQSPSSRKRFMLWADLGRLTPLSGIPVRIEDDRGVFPNPPPARHDHVIVTGTFVCKEQRGHSVMLGYLVPTRIVVNR